MKAVITLLILSLLTGCVHQTRPVSPPVPQIVTAVPKPPPVLKPTLDITTLSDSDKTNLGIVAQSYVVTVDQLKAYVHNLELIVAKYLELSKQNTMPVAPLTVDGLSNPVPPQKLHEPLNKKP